MILLYPSFIMEALSPSLSPSVSSTGRVPVTAPSVQILSLKTIDNNGRVSEGSPVPIRLTTVTPRDVSLRYRALSSLSECEEMHDD